MKMYPILIAILLCVTSWAQEADVTNSDAYKFIQNYYSTFATGYDLDDRYVIISENYKAIFSDTTFTLTFDTIDKNRDLQKQIVSIDLKDVISIEPNGLDVVEIMDYETYAIPVCWKLAFITANETYVINIYYEVDEDVEQTEIYKAFENLIKIKQ
ncbi:hypothetical protein ATE92_2072 [Ulvibacter sp. MAR_2010_11]|uniref:hypothetical protein n=1 Tax=Ulvibacter sp. MAR_2010_11 TaxID=1250229 RepID=UPI000C2C228F|nr:hypothetical protein [Ulvibacter sp. MAR_2010_11]PKA83903.1 hypothetical protein ATE92_2072 [Ulvibacter sp. MAR_2010_11]